MTPQWAMYSRSMAISGAQARRNANPRRRWRDVGRAVVFGARLAGRLEPERHDVDDRETEQDEGDGHHRDPMQGRQGEDGKRQRWDHDQGQVVGAPDEGETEPAPTGRDEPRHERERRRQRGRDPDPLEDPGRDERR